MAKARLIAVFDLSDAQADYILELQLRRLTRFSRIELETERDELLRQIEELEAILADEKLLHRTVSDRARRRRQGARHPAPHRAARVGRHARPRSPTPLEVTDDPCWVLLSSTGLLARTVDGRPGARARARRAKHDAVIGAVRTTARGEFALVTSPGRMVRMSALELPTLPPTGRLPEPVRAVRRSPSTSTCPPARSPSTIVPLDADGPGLALGTAQGVVKRVTTDYPSRPDWEVVALRDGDTVVGAAALHDGGEDLVFVTSDAQLLRFPASAVRPQGRAAGGMAGIRLARGRRR